MSAVWLRFLDRVLIIFYPLIQVSRQQHQVQQPFLHDNPGTMRGSKEDTEEGLATLPSGAGEVDNDPTLAHDAVFGNITEKGPNYRDVHILYPPSLNKELII